jgi:hypothetical protein
MDHFTREQLAELASLGKEASVSIYMPLHRTPGETDQDPIRLRNLLDEAEKTLTSSGLRGPAVKDILEPARSLQKDRSAWRASGDEGLAILLAPGFFRSYRLPYPLPDSVDVANSFHVSPLAHMLMWDQSFFLFGLAEKHLRLYRCTRRSIVPVELPKKMPKSLQEALAGTELEKSLQQHTASAVTPGAARTGIVHGHGDPKDYQKVLLTEYFRIVAAHLDDLLHNERLPLVLAAVDYYHPMFHHTCRYPHFVKEGIVGSPDQLKDAELHERALPIVEPWFRQQLHRAAARYGKLAGNDRTSNELASIVSAAHAGRIDSLFAQMGGRVWGKFHPDNGKAEVHSHAQTGDVDLLDLAVRKSLTSGSEVFVVPGEDVPGVGPAAALFRW